MNSRFETFSLICVEAMSCGKPVLATRCGGPNEFMDENNGVLIEVDNENELHDQFIFMLKNFRQFDPEKIRNSVEVRYNQQNVAKEFDELYRKALKN